MSKGGRGKCLVCAHPKKAEIEADLREGLVAFVDIARTYGVSESSLRNHRRKHLKAPDGSPIDRSELVRELNDLKRMARAEMDKARRSGDTSEARAARKELRAILKDIGTLLGLIGTPKVQVGVGVQVNTDGQSGRLVQQALFRALDRHPEARRDVVVELKALDTSFAAPETIDAEPTV